MIKQEAERIAAAVNIIKPEWRVGLIMAVLGDERIRSRSYADVLIAMTALAVDPTSQRPGRIHEPGPWWRAAAAVTSPMTAYRTIGQNDCDICSRPYEQHAATSQVDGHKFERLGSRGKGQPPTAEQKQAIAAAISAGDTSRCDAEPSQPKTDNREA